MSTVVAQPYSTAGNGGRKLVRLSNGWEVAVTKIGKQIDFHVSKDGGKNWVLLTTQAYAYAVIDVAIVSKGNTVYYLSTTGASQIMVWQGKFDATTVGSVTGAYGLDANQTQLGNVSLAINPQGTELHAAWSSKNATYPNSINIRYAKGKINADGSVTWGAVEQISTYNYSNYFAQEPSIVIKSDGYPLIITRTRPSTSTDYIRAWYYDGSLWSFKEIYSGTRNLAQSSPSAVVDKDGVIHVAWLGNSRVKYAKSSDGGVSWNVFADNNALSAVDGKGASISVDNTNHVVIAYIDDASNILCAVDINGNSFGTRYALHDTRNGNYIEGAENPSILFDPTFFGKFGNSSYDYPATIVTSTSLGAIMYTGSYTTNQLPSISVTSPTSNQTLYENDTFNINGTVKDTDNGNSVTVRYQIDANTVRAIKAFVSDGTTLEAFSKSLRFSGGSLYDGDTLIASNLTDGVAHKLKVWATDDQGGTSIIVERDFYVVPNRAPSLTVEAPVITGNVNSDKFTVSGSYNDADGNTTTVKYRINGGNSVQVASGISGAFDFEISFAQLTTGPNTIVVEAIDSYGAKTSKTVKLNKNIVETAKLRSTARYKILPPSNKAQAVLLWIERDKDLTIDVSISMTMTGEAESFAPVTVEESVPIANGSSIYEDTFFYEADAPKDNIIVQIDMTRKSVDADDKITLISGVLE